MTLYFRLFIILILASFRKTKEVLGPVYSSFRVWPSDLDMFGHMTNSRYLSLMDVSRTDLIARAGLLPELRKRGWYPVVVEESIQFRRSLNPFEKFQLKTEITGYDDRHVILKQTFLHKGKVAALGIVRARFLGPGKDKVSPQQLIALAENGDSIPRLQISQEEKLKYEYLKNLIKSEVASAQ